MGWVETSEKVGSEGEKSEPWPVARTILFQHLIYAMSKHI